MTRDNFASSSAALGWGTRQPLSRGPWCAHSCRFHPSPPVLQVAHYACSFVSDDGTLCNKVLENGMNAVANLKKHMATHVEETLTTSGAVVLSTKSKHEARRGLVLGILRDGVAYAPFAEPNRGVKQALVRGLKSSGGFSTTNSPSIPLTPAQTSAHGPGTCSRTRRC